MRRVLGSLLVVVFMIPALAVLAPGSANYKDSFDGGGYSGNDGSLDFDGPWVEFGDGSSSSPTSGLIHVDSSGCSGDCVHLDGGVLAVAEYGLARAADLSMFQSVDLSFDIEVEPDLLGALLNTATLQVQVLDGGWVTVETFSLKQSTSEHVVIEVTDHASENFQVRFRIPTLGLVYNGTTTIDNVELNGTIIATTTTSSTTTTTTTTTTAPGPTITLPEVTIPTIPGLDPPGLPTTTSTTQPSSSTIPGSAPTTSDPDAPSEGSTGGSGGTTTTTIQETTTTSAGDDPAAGATGGIPPGSGLRQASVGLIADFETGMMGDVGMGRVEVLGAELTADFSLAVEAFEKTRVWIGALALLMAVAVVSGMDRRRARRQAADPA